MNFSWLAVKVTRCRVALEGLVARPLVLVSVLLLNALVLPYDSAALRNRHGMKGTG